MCASRANHERNEGSLLLRTLSEALSIGCAVSLNARKNRERDERGHSLLSRLWINRAMIVKRLRPLSPGSPYTQIPAFNIELIFRLSFCSVSVSSSSVSAASSESVTAASF
jgi:hypothetical protein